MNPKAVATTVAAVVLLAGCGSPAPARPRPTAAPPQPVYAVSPAAAATYARTHPVPPVPGTIAGILVAATEVWSGTSSTWTGYIATASGQRTVTCFSPAYGCGVPGGITWAGTGDYDYWPLRKVASLNGIRVIRYDVVRTP